MLSPERLSELREDTRALGARNRIHRLTNEELVWLLDRASERGPLMHKLVTARGERDDAFRERDLHVDAFVAQKRERDQIKAERDAAQEELADLRLCDQRARALLAGALGGGEDATQPVDVLAASVNGEMVGARKNLEDALGRAPQGPERFSLPVLAIEVYRLLKKARTERDIVDTDLGESLAEARAQRAGVERELLEVRAELARVLGDQVSSYMTPVGLARAVASRVEELRERMRGWIEQARTGKFAGPPQDASPADNATWIFAMDTALADAAKKARTAWTIARGNCASSAPSETRRALQAARAAYNVSTRSLHAALTLMELGIAELLDAVEAGAIKLYAAAEIAQLAPAKQYETLDKVLASAEVRA